jgi:hypothetical protein
VQQSDRVEQVFAVDLHDLQLGEQHISGSQCLLCQLKAVVEAEFMAHLESANEDVQLAAVGLVVVEQAARTVQAVEAAICRVA